MMYALTVFTYSEKSIDTELWDNFKREVIKGYDGISRRDGVPFRYWRTLLDEALTEYDAKLVIVDSPVSGPGHISFKTAEQRMAFIMRYS